MTTRTEESLQALVAAVLAQSLVEDAALPTPKRNEALPARLMQPAAGEPEKYLNIWDGDGAPTDETLGADDASQDDGYQIEHRATIEWVVAGGADADREALFDAGLEQLHAACKRDADTGLYLEGVVSMAAIAEIRRSGGKGLVTDGLPNIKAAEITILLTFTSSRPF
jgi:hypothetical protein